MNPSAVTYFTIRKDQSAEDALRAIDALSASLAAARAAISAGLTPARGAGSGDMGLIGRAAEVQRHTDAWIFNAEAAMVVRNSDLRSGVVQGDEN
jgi:hypothetical protein